MILLTMLVLEVVFESSVCLGLCIVQQSPQLFHLPCVLLSFCSSQVRLLELGIVDLVCTRLFVVFCGAVPSSLDCCTSRRRYCE